MIVCSNHQRTTPVYARIHLAAGHFIYLSIHTFTCCSISTGFGNAHYNTCVATFCPLLYMHPALSMIECVGHTLADHKSRIAYLCEISTKSCDGGLWELGGSQQRYLSSSTWLNKSSRSGSPWNICQRRVKVIKEQIPYVIYTQYRWSVRLTNMQYSSNAYIYIHTRLTKLLTNVYIYVEIVTWVTPQRLVNSKTWRVIFIFKNDLQLCAVMTP